MIVLTFLVLVVLLTLALMASAATASLPVLAGIPVTSFVTCNINSLSLNEPGGLAGRKHAAINTIAALARAHDVVCIQDVRAGSDDCSSELRSDLPLHGIEFNSNSTTHGGVMTIVAPRLRSQVQHRKLIDNQILSSTITDPNNSNCRVTFVNCYLNPTNRDHAWSDQVEILKSSLLPANTVLLGDFNHAPLHEDRSSDYVDRSDTARELFSGMLEDHCLSEVPQQMHTFYRYHGRTGTLTSSKVDHVYTNFSYTTLIKHHPEAHIYTSAPNTLCAYRKQADWSSTPGKNSDWDDPTLQDRQFVASFPKVKEGASHITDHLPISVRLTDVSAEIAHSPVRISKAVYDHPDFVSVFLDIWNGSMRPSLPWPRAKQLKRTIHLAAKEIRKRGCTKNMANEVNDDIRLAIKILLDAEAISHKHLCDRYPDQAHLTSLAANGAGALLDHINNELAVRAIDAENGQPVSKIAALAKTLPLARCKITHLYDPSEEERRDNTPTSDKRKITDIIHGFWHDKWSHKRILDPTQLFRAFGRKIKCAPASVTLESFIQAISTAAKRTLPLAPTASPSRRTPGSTPSLPQSCLPATVQCNKAAPHLTTSTKATFMSFPKPLLIVLKTPGLWWSTTLITA